MNKTKTKQKVCDKPTVEKCVSDINKLESKYLIEVVYKATRVYNDRAYKIKAAAKKTTKKVTKKSKK